MKSKICILLILVMLLSSGCNNGKTKSIGIPIEDFQKQDIVMPDINTKNNAVFEALSEEMDSVEVADKVGTCYWGVKSEFNEDKQQLDSGALLVELNPYKEIPLQYPKNFPQWQTGSGSYVIMQNQYIYEWLSYTAYSGDQTIHDMKLIRIDVKTGEVSVVNEVRLNTPLVYLCSIDDTHFLSYYVTKTDSDKAANATLTVAEIYDTSGTRNEIIREKYENDVGWTDSEGTLIERLTVSDGEIYGVGRRRVSNRYEFYLYHYSKDGELLETQDIPDLQKVIGDEQPLEFHLIGDYMVIRTYESLTTYICKRTKNGLEYIAKGEQGSVSYAVSSNDKGSYIFFIESNVNYDATIKEKECPFYVINVNNGKIMKFNFTIPLKNPYFVNLQRLSNGDLLTSYCDGQYDPLNMKKFILQKDKLYQLLDALS